MTRDLAPRVVRLQLKFAVCREVMSMKSSVVRRTDERLQRLLSALVPEPRCTCSEAAFDKKFTTASAAYPVRTSVARAQLGHAQAAIAA